MKDYVVFDIETTGLHRERNEIIQIGAIKVRNGVEVERFSQYVKPKKAIPVFITELTGINDETVKGALGIEEVLPEFYKFCEELPLMGYNLPFDYGFVKEKGKQLGIDFSLGGVRQGIDVLKLYRKYYTLPSFKLENVAKHILGNVGKGYHNACYDVYITKLLYENLLGNEQVMEDVRVPNYLEKVPVKRNIVTTDNIYDIFR